MRALRVTGGVAVIVCGIVAAAQAEVTSGPQVGDTVGAFTVTKVTGNPDDGVADGKTLCYRCKMGQRPVVMVFARSADEKFAKFLKKLEGELEEHAGDKLTAFVNMIGTDADSLKKSAADFVAKHGIKRVAFVVPEDAANGPPEFKIAPDADVTVVCYKGGQVKANHAIAKGGLSDDKIGAIVEASCHLVE
ncbi:MAG: hypothetical protein FJ284_07795 [Planctomycetes bacterium]|nr:hypothetical protein [Planctomycetota bacterium]